MSRNKKSTAILLNDEEKSKFDVEIKVEEESSSALRMESLSYVILACQYGACSRISRQECEGICEEIIDSIDILEGLCDYLDLSTEEAQHILKRASRYNSIDSGNDSDSDADVIYKNNGKDEQLYDNYEDDDSSIESADDYIQEGECELCERELKMTLHHLIPKCTWKQIKPRYLEAAEYYRNGQMKKVKDIIDLGGDELPIGISLKTFKTGAAVNSFLSNFIANLCAPCHNCVHAHHRNRELTEKFNSVEKILEDEPTYKF